MMHLFIIILHRKILLFMEDGKIEEKKESAIGRRTKAGGEVVTECKTVSIKTLRCSLIYSAVVFAVVSLPFFDLFQGLLMLYFPIQICKTLQYILRLSSPVVVVGRIFQGWQY